MVSVIIHAGLANKMFEYSFAYSLLKSNYNVGIDQKTFTPVWEFEDVLLSEIFDELTLKEDVKKYSKLVYKKDFYSKILRHIYIRKSNNKLIYENNYRYNSEIYKRITQDCSVYGLWQSPKYFNNFRTDL